MRTTAQWTRNAVGPFMLVMGLVGACGPGGGPYSIRGSARLPACEEPPAFNFNGTSWVDSGNVTATTPGCEIEVGVPTKVCGLLWEFSQTGGELDILVDGEYQIQGRLCGDQLHLEGGWWLPVVNDFGNCTYEEEDAAEVGIESEGATLTAMANELTGTLALREACTGTYAVTFSGGL